jgi:hypothetical protein
VSVVNGDGTTVMEKQSDSIETSSSGESAYVSGWRRQVFRDGLSGHLPKTR